MLREVSRVRVATKGASTWVRPFLGEGHGRLADRDVRHDDRASDRVMRWRAWLLLALIGVAPHAWALDAGQAYAQVLAQAQATYDALSPTDKASRKVCAWLSNPAASAGVAYGITTLKATTCPTSGISGQVPQYTVAQQSYTGTCSARAQQPTWMAPGGGPTAVCSQGCSYTYVVDAGVPKGYTYIASGNTCSTADAPEPKVDTDGDGVPDENDAFPNDPNESKDSDGDGIGDNADFSPNDPDDGKDDGEGDEKDNTASGGGDCNAPPSCSGDGIQCAQLMTQWKIMCKGAKVTGSPEVCSSAYTCSGDAAQCAQIALLRVSACKDLTPGNGNGPYGDANKNGVPDVMEGTIGSTPDPSLSDAWSDEEGDGAGWAKVDKSGWLGGGQCPGLPEIQIAGRSVRLDEKLCEQAGVVGAAIYAFGLLAAAYIIGAAASKTGD